MPNAVDQIIAEAMEAGMRLGIEQEKAAGIANMIELCKNLGLSYSNTQLQLEMRYDIKEMEAKAYLEQYWINE